MKIKALFLLLSLGIVSASELTAPSFQLMNQNGENIELDSFKGKKVILEWTNHDCPFVQRHYETCLLYTSPSPRDRQKSRMPSSA